MSTSAYRIDRLRDFIVMFGGLVDTAPNEATLLHVGAARLRRLIADDDWLPDAFAAHDPERYQQHLLHCDPAERFSVVSFVWGPGQSTPVHDHTVWGLIGMLRGAEVSQAYAHGPTGFGPAGTARRLEPGDVEALSPEAGDIHQVSNAHSDRVSISIHVYGANIGAVARSTFDAKGRRKPFVSGYSNVAVPNLWDRSEEVRARLTDRETA